MTDRPDDRHTASDDRGHWLTRPATVRVLWGVFALVLSTTVAIQRFVPVKATFGLDGTFAFAAWFGFAACLLMVLLARVLGWLVKRPEDYYGDAAGDEGRAEHRWDPIAPAAASSPGDEGEGPEEERA